MSTHATQNGSAGLSAKHLLEAGLKIAGYGLVTVFSVLGAHALRDHLHREKHMKDTVENWIKVLSHLDRKQRAEIEPVHLESMLRRLKQLEMSLSVLELSLRDATMWSRAAGRHADRLRKVQRLVETADDDLRTRVGHLLDIPDGSPKGYCMLASTIPGSCQTPQARLAGWYQHRDVSFSRVTAMMTPLSLLRSRTKIPYDHSSPNYDNNMV
ncbi:hypothetical protein VTO73DRAFT_15033 [Trametes versicolor]